MAQEPKRNRHHAAPRRELYIPRKTRWAIALSALGVIVVCLLITAFVRGWIELPKWPSSTDETTPPQVQEDTVIHIVAGGDVNITDRVVFAGGSGYDYSNVFMDILPVLSGADLTIANFEGNACGAPYGSQMNSAPQQLLSALQSAGVDVLQTANSHALTNGLIGLVATNDAIRAAGMQPLGTYANQREFEKYGGYLIYEVKGIRIALVAFTKGMDGRSLPEGREDCVNLLYTDYSSTYKSIDRDGITAVLQAAAAEEPDITIALLHWGGENNDLLSSSQESICSLMEGLGVDAIIGTHSHHVQKMGFRDESGMFVAYCLGDLMGDAETANTSYSVLLDLEITKDGPTGQVRISGYDYTPVYLNYGDDGSLQLQRIQEALAAYESNYIASISDEAYAALKAALSRIQSRVEG